MSLRERWGEDNSWVIILGHLKLWLRFEGKAMGWGRPVNVQVFCCENPKVCHWCL